MELELSVTHHMPLVSIVTPCYNGEKFVHRFLDSILSQTYKNIELIFINDGSIDKTEEVVLSYMEKFIEKNITLIYIYQENKGLAGAINTGLLKVNGKYLCWPDSDDYLESESIEKRVNILESFPEYAVVTSDAYIRDIDNLKEYIGLIAGKSSEKYLENQFELMLFSKSIFCPGTHMVRMSSFRDTHVGGQIYPCRRGQNWQMLLPIYYKYKRFFLDEPLYNYIIYKSSMSQGDNNEEKKLYRCQEHEEILINTLSYMNMTSDVKDKYLTAIKILYSKKRLNIAFQYRNLSLFQNQYTYIKSIKELELKDFIYYVMIRNVILYNLFKPILSHVIYIKRFINTIVR